MRLIATDLRSALMRSISCMVWAEKCDSPQLGHDHIGTGLPITWGCRLLQWCAGHRWPRRAASSWRRGLRLEVSVSWRCSFSRFPA